MEYPSNEELREIWDIIQDHVSRDSTSSRMQSIFKDLSEMLSKPENISKVKIISHYIASYPASYSTVAESLGVSREYLFKVLNREAIKFPWLHEMIFTQSTLFYKGNRIKELRKAGNIKV